MKIITARQFNRKNPSEIGKYLSKNPLDYFFVSNKTDPRKNFICCKPDFLMEFEKDIWKLQELALLQDRFEIERHLMSKKMSRKYWDGVKIARNGNKDKVESIRPDIRNNNSVASLIDDVTSLADMEVSRGRGSGMVCKIYD
jgi:hypothetical protein